MSAQDLMGEDANVPRQSSVPTDHQTGELMSAAALSSPDILFPDFTAEEWRERHVAVDGITNV